jgi:hypothetical protein
MNEFNAMRRPAQGRRGSRLSRRVLLSLPFLLAAAAAGAAEPRTVGMVSRLAGPPSILRGGQQLAAQRGMVLREGDRVVTGAGGRLEITAADGSTITVGEQTTVVLTRFVAPGDAGPGQGFLDLVEGILRLNLPGSWNRFEVITATAVASVRGTDWLIDAQGAENTAVFVAKGSVAVENIARTGAVILYPGFGTDVKAGGLPTTPKLWAKKRVDAALGRTAIS